jgi:nucleoid-associated protein YgaU
MIRPKVTKSITWFDSQLTPQDRLDAYGQLSPRAKEMLKKIGYRPGTVPSQLQMEALYRETDKQAARDIIRACINSSLRPSLAGVNELLRCIRAAEAAGLPNGDRLLEMAQDAITSAMDKIEMSAYRAFRQFPSSERYSACFAVRRALDALGLEESLDYPVNPWPQCHVKPPHKPGPYVVVLGDTLSKIAKRFYGQECLWDAIYESNGYHGHPDRISPGQHLIIK